MHDRDPFTADPKRTPRAIALGLLGTVCAWAVLIVIGAAVVKAVS